jgi:hypothetical protein
MSEKTVDQLQREDVERQALEEAARRIESLAGNELYRKAWAKAAKAVRALKDLTRS